MKSMLDEKNIKYEIINIKQDSKALDFMKEQGHRVVPQLYVGEVHINKKTNTQEYTSGELYDIIADVLDQQDWPWSDSGIEQGI
jgi:glutaredoxin